MKKLLSILLALSCVSFGYCATNPKYYKTRKIEMPFKHIIEELGEPEKPESEAKGSEAPAITATYTWAGIGKITFHFSRGNQECNRIDLIPSRIMSENDIFNFAANMYGLYNIRLKTQLAKFKFKKGKPRELCFVSRQLPEGGFSYMPFHGRVYYDGKTLIIAANAFPELEKRLKESGDTIEESF